MLLESTLTVAIYYFYPVQGFGFVVTAVTTAENVTHFVSLSERLITGSVADGWSRRCSIFLVNDVSCVTMLQLDANNAITAAQLACPLPLVEHRRRIRLLDYLQRSPSAPTATLRPQKKQSRRIFGIVLFRIGEFFL